MSELIKADAGVRQFCSFRTEGRLYGIDTAQVREISTQTMITPVPQAPPAVRGLANLRSRIYLVVDVRPILGLAPTVTTADSRVIVLKPDVAERVGILVEHGGDILHAPVAQIELTSAPTTEPADECRGGAPAVIVGVCRLDGELMNIIDSTYLIEAIERLMQ